MRVLVTGGLGFLGHAVLHRLLEVGHSPIALSSRSSAVAAIPGVETIHADVRHREALAQAVRRANPQGVCHLAALTRVRGSFSSPLDYFDVNVGGTSALLHSVRELGPLPIVLASTGAVYGPCEGRIGEDQPTLPSNPYGATKLAAEHLLRYHAQTGAVGVIVLRCFNISGAVGGVTDPDTTRIIPGALAVAAGHTEHLDINGPGTAVREFTHVADVADAIVIALKAVRPAQAETYNVGSGVAAAVIDVIGTVERITGRKVHVRHQPPRPEAGILTADSTRIRAELGWQPRHVTLEAMIADAWRAHSEPSRAC